MEAKVDDVVPTGEDREWLRLRLRALLGLEAPPASRDENFAAWLRFVEEIAVGGPTVLVFEDLHWADEALLAFFEHLLTSRRRRAPSRGRHGATRASRAAAPRSPQAART